MTYPMAFGIISILLFNLVDTFWVGQLGAKELAALSFTFPVSFVVMSLTMGLGVGMSAAISHAIGSGDDDQVRRLATQGLLLSLCIVLVVASLGLFTIDPLFTLMGACSEVRGHINDYMTIWYLGVGFLVIPMTGNAAIRGTGDAMTPGVIMMVSAGANAVLDPLLIFGIGPFPSLGIQGAALATVISWTAALVASLWVMGRRNGLLRVRCLMGPGIITSWRRILYVGFPAASTNILAPVSAAILTMMVAGFGNESVAGFGVGTRIDPLALVVVMALASVLTPFTGQNWGAKNFQRVRRGIRLSLRFAMLWELGMFAVLLATNHWIADAFTDNQEVEKTIIRYLWIMPISYGLQGSTLICCSVLNAIRRPLYAMGLTVLRLFILTVPLAYIGGRLIGTTGIFFGASLSNIITGVIAMLTVRVVLRNAEAAVENGGE